MYLRNDDDPDQPSSLVPNPSTQAPPRSPTASCGASSKQCRFICCMSGGVRWRDVFGGLFYLRRLILNGVKNQEYVWCTIKIQGCDERKCIRRELCIARYDKSSTVHVAHLGDGSSSSSTLLSEAVREVHRRRRFKLDFRQLSTILYSIWHLYPLHFSQEASDSAYDFT